MDIMDNMDSFDDLDKLDPSPAKSSALCKCESLLKKLCSARIRSDLDLKMSVVGKGENGEDEVEYCAKRIKDDSECELVRALGVAAAMCIGISLICSVCSLIKRL